MTENKAVVKMILNMRKEHIVYKLREAGLSVVGNKPELAKILASFQEEEMDRLYRSI